MNSLDKDMMHYFYDEMEKQAILWATIKGAGKLLAASAKGAAQGIGNYTKGMTHLSAMGRPIGVKHLAGGALLTGVSVHALNKGYQGYKNDRLEQKQSPQPVTSGNINLEQY